MEKIPGRRQLLMRSPVLTLTD